MEYIIIIYIYIYDIKLSYIKLNILSQVSLTFIETIYTISYIVIVHITIILNIYSLKNVDRCNYILVIKTLFKNLYIVRGDSILLTDNSTVPKIGTVVHLYLLGWRWLCGNSRSLPP